MIIRKYLLLSVYFFLDTLIISDTYEVIDNNKKDSEMSSNSRTARGGALFICS